MRKCPIKYDLLCRQTVTVYHRTDDTHYTKTVIDRAFLEFRKNHNVEKTGSSETNSFLLIVPGATQNVFVEDKVLLGVGDDIKDRAEWSALIPTKVSGLAVVKYVDPKYWDGQLVHMEAGG